MKWRLSPEQPVEPGLYLTVETPHPAEVPRAMHWRDSGSGWRWGYQRRPVYAFLGPLPAYEHHDPHADVARLFAPPLPGPSPSATPPPSRRPRQEPRRR